MKTKQIQFNRQRVAAFLVAGLILATTSALTGAEVSRSTFQPAKMVQSWFEFGTVAGSNLETVTDGGKPLDGDSALSSGSQLLTIKGGLTGGVVGS